MNEGGTCSSSARAEQLRLSRKSGAAVGLLSQNSVTKVAMMASWYHNASQSFRPMPKGAYASEALPIHRSLRPLY